MREPGGLQEPRRDLILRPAARDEEPRRPAKSILEDTDCGRDQEGLILGCVPSEAVMAQVKSTGETGPDLRILRMEVDPDVMATEVPIRNLARLGREGQAQGKGQGVREPENFRKGLCDSIHESEIVADRSPLNPPGLHMANDDDFQRQPDGLPCPIPMRVRRLNLTCQRGR